ncbi:MAG: C2H2-type zinc finger protein [Kangiellaceae bacterium]|jgi:ribosomal protein L29|nr:C2H2-type zinc finger protein [Kangiellaceae bacterium]
MLSLLRFVANPYVEGELEQQRSENLFMRLAELEKKLASVRDPSIASQADKMEMPKTVRKIIKQRRPAASIIRYHKCPYCPKSYGSESALRIHNRLKHEGIDSPE